MLQAIIHLALTTILREYGYLIYYPYLIFEETDLEMLPKLMYLEGRAESKKNFSNPKAFAFKL